MSGGLGEYRRTIPAGKTTNIDVRGSTVILRTIRGGYEVQVGTRSNKLAGGDGVKYQVTMRLKEKLFTATEFDRIELANNGEDDITVEFLIGYGDYVEPPPTPESADGILAQNVGVGDTPNPALPTIPQNARRRRVHIQNNTEDTTFFVGGLEVVPNPAEPVGYQLFPAQTITLETAAAVWVCAPTGSGEVSVDYLEEYFA